MKILNSLVVQHNENEILKNNMFNNILNLYIYPYSFEILNEDKIINNFLIVDIILEFKKKKYKGFIFLKKIKEFGRKDIIRIMTEKIPNIQYNNSVLIYIDRKKIKIIKN